MGVVSKFSFRIFFIAFLCVLFTALTSTVIFPLFLKQYIVHSRAGLLANLLQTVDYTRIAEGTEDAENAAANGLHLLITDSSMKVIYDNSAEDSRLGAFLVFENAVRDGDEALSFSAYVTDGAFTYCFWYPLENGGWTCVTFADTESYVLYNRYRLNFRLLLLVFLCITLLYIFRLVYLYKKRTNALSETVVKLQNGDLKNAVPADGKDDISEIHRMLNDFILRQQKTEELRQRFVSDASHELKTPLASVKLLSESVLYTPNISPEDTKEFLTDINQEIDRLTRICSKLLLLSKYDTGHRIAGNDITDLREVVENVSRILHQRAEESSLAIRKELQNGCYVRADYDMMYQVVFNLTENAIKYGVDGDEIRILLYTKGYTITLIVDDDGCGVPEAELPLIFDRFYRVDTARARATGGSGLGLSIVKTAVTSCGGEVSVKNRTPHGARFEVHLPLAENDFNESPEEEPYAAQ